MQCVCAGGPTTCAAESSTSGTRPPGSSRLPTAPPVSMPSRSFCARASSSTSATIATPSTSAVAPLHAACRAFASAFSPSSVGPKSGSRSSKKPMPAAATRSAAFCGSRRVGGGRENCAELRQNCAELRQSCARLQPLRVLAAVGVEGRRAVDHGVGALQRALDVGLVAQLALAEREAVEAVGALHLLVELERDPRLAVGERRPRRPDRAGGVLGAHLVREVLVAHDVVGVADERAHAHERVVAQQVAAHAGADAAVAAGHDDRALRQRLASEQVERDVHRFELLRAREGHRDAVRAHRRCRARRGRAFEGSRCRDRDDHRH